ncbi:MAG TPA: sigma-70 family RNA polymerase sigma factor [Gemmatimonadaceae bacterium]
MTPADAPIVSRVLDGDREAFAILVDRHYERCVRVAMHLLGNREDAEDAAQETFLRAYRHLAKYQERERFAAWLLRILTNQCRTQLARRRTEAARGAGDGFDAGTLPLDEPLPSERAGLGEELARALALLPADQREAVVLRFAEDLSYDEMAAVTGAGVSALKMRVQRACTRLRALLMEVYCV